MDIALGDPGCPGEPVPLGPVGLGVGIGLEVLTLKVWKSRPVTLAELPTRRMQGGDATKARARR
jgi:hypothetical protein